MARFKLDKNGISRLRKHLKSQVVKVEQKMAREAYDYFLNFGYHVDGGGVEIGGGGYSLYYVANWNCAINERDTSVISPRRSINDAKPNEFEAMIDPDKALRVSKDLKCGDSISVTNSVYYGPWLNHGGVLSATYNKISAPNRFLEQCRAHIEANSKYIIRQTAKEEPAL
jgi:hypothetical protein